MKGEYILQGLDCANCAAMIEDAVRKSDGVEYASVSFVKGSISVQWAEGVSGGVERLDSIVRRVESGITIVERTQSNGTSHAHGHDRLLYIRLIVGAVVFGVGLLLEHVFTVNQYAVLAVYIVGFLILGGDVLFKALKNITRGKIFDENFLMSIATVGAFAIGEYAEGVGVMLFYQVGELFQGLAVSRAKKSITKLMDIRPDFANRLSGGELVRVAPQDVEVGDTIVVKAGERIPLDGVVVEGRSTLDTAALTGESLPKTVSAGDAVLSGSVNQSGVLTIRVEQTFGQSTVSKIIDLVENASEKKAPTENFITKFARLYTPVVVALAAIIAIVPPLFIGMHMPSVWSDWVRRGLIFLVISCPCALVISIPLGFFGGIGGASRRGVLIKGGNYLEALNRLEAVVFDKTGTLTKGVFKVTQINAAEGFTDDDLLLAAARAEAFSNHPIALSILREQGDSVDKSSLLDYTEIAGQGVSVNDGGTIILAGSEVLMKSNDISYSPCQAVGTKVYVSIGGRFAGCIVISDEIKPDAVQAIASLKNRNIRTVMLTGDNAEIAQAVAAQLGIDEVHAGLLPQHKVERVQLLNAQKRGGKLAFMGDGINDAPVLALSDIGISMGGLGSDAAIEAADIVIMTDEPSKLEVAIDTAKFTRRVVWQNIVFSLAVKAAFLLLGAFGIATMWEAVFADVGVALLAILNALRVLHKKG